MIPAENTWIFCFSRVSMRRTLRLHEAEFFYVSKSPLTKFTARLSYIQEKKTLSMNYLIPNLSPKMRETSMLATVSPVELTIVAGGSISVPTMEISGSASAGNP
ncbi:MAG: hypothetical protein BWY42_00233 [Candidatus Omnitrophica bacterium ADurb.Bin277]|nr:MAG: hypothetical protein BWY42_00233 [Candidatus Omnitrophica bacterium ADurb.Bin277]